MQHTITREVITKREGKRERKGSCSRRKVREYREEILVNAGFCFS
jgi:hypothetical protein